MAWNDRGFVKAKAIRYDLELPTGPVDPFRVAESLGIAVVAAQVGEDSPVEGMYIRQAGRGFVFVNSSKARRRQRLTCAHEIGHHVLLEGQEDVQVIEGPGALSGAGPGSSERDAFRFASELLMDERGIRAEFAEAQRVLQGIAHVVIRYDVSPSSACIRLSELGLISQQETNDFLAEIDTKEGWRAFVDEFAIRQRESTGTRRLLPASFLDRANRLHDAGVLSDRRFAELVTRPLPSAA